MVLSVDPGGAAGEDGRLAMGDWICRINGTKVCAEDKNQVARLLASADLEFEVLRDTGAGKRVAIPKVKTHLAEHTMA